jgi:folate-dependent phosphoribosylglycinamide formyltransferase PurN
LAYFQEYEKTIDAEIVVVISPFENGSAASKTNAFNEARHSSISHITFSTYTTEEYQRITKTYAIDLHFFSGWLKLVKGLDPLTAINIHPGPIQMVRDISGNTWHFGGK